jgi:hypothetical protein
MVSTDDAERNTSLRGIHARDANPMVGAGAATAGPLPAGQGESAGQTGHCDRHRRAGHHRHKPSARYGLAAFIYLTALFSVHTPSDPDHNREFALGANTTIYRLATSLQVFTLIPLILGGWYTAFD